MSSSGLVDHNHRFGGSPAPGHLPGPGFPGAAFLDGPRTTQVVIGNEKLMRCMPEILELRRRCGQEDDLTTDPEYFVAAMTAPNRRCAAVLIRQDRALQACVLFYEHTRFGIGLGLFRGGDYIGESLIVGPPALHVPYVHLATQALLKKFRIHGVSLSMKACVADCIQLMGPAGEFRRFLGSEIQHKLPLENTYEGMLASMGPRTRRSLAGKRQQLEKSTQVQFVPVLEADQALEVMLGLESKSTPHHIPEFLHARHRLLLAHPDFFSMGLRLPDGKWLSLLTGWRRKRVTYVDLQMNDMHYKKESISAVMRAFMLEHEIGRKQEIINFVGGSSLLLRRYCEPIEPCTEILICKPGFLTNFFAWMGRYAPSTSVYQRLKPGAVSATNPEAETQASGETEQ